VDAEPWKRGKIRDIYLCDSASETLESILAKASKDRKLQQMVAKLQALFERFVETGKITNREQFNSEADGFWAFKAYQLRAYCWYSRRLPRALVISHFVVKKKDKLAASDKQRMQRNREAFETRA
jgi:hypothetical protein